MIHALDFSSGARDITASWARKRKEEGVTLMVSQLWGGWSHNSHAERALTICKQEGLDIAGYVYLSDQYRGNFHVQAGKEAAGSTWDSLAFVAIDVEYHQGAIPDLMIKEALEEVEKTQTPIIYTAQWYWDAYRMSSTSFSEYPCWSAFYDGVPELDVRPYGGWSTFIGKQYKGTTDIDGIACDLNVFRSLPEKGVSKKDQFLHEFWAQAKRLEKSRYKWHRDIGYNIEKSVRVHKGEEVL